MTLMLCLGAYSVFFPSLPSSLPPSLPPSLPSYPKMPSNEPAINAAPRPDASVTSAKACWLIVSPPSSTLSSEK